MDDFGELIVDTTTDAIGDCLTGIPAPIRKNAFKALGQLCTAVVDIPVAYLEGIAAEKRAETDGRIKILNTGSAQIAKQMQVDPEYSRVAMEKYCQKIVRGQVNLDKIAHNAVCVLTHESSLGIEYSGNPSSTEEISEDWLNVFEREASTKSSDEMQLLWGKILAGEIKKPNTYSLRTLDLLKSITPIEAETFCKIGAFAIRLGSKEFILREDAAGKDEPEFTLSELLILEELGLIYPKNKELALRVSPLSKGEDLHIIWGDTLIIIKGKSDTENINLPAIFFTRPGIELLNFVDKPLHEEYLARLCSKLRINGNVQTFYTKILSRTGDSFHCEDPIEVK